MTTSAELRALLETRNDARRFAEREFYVRGTTLKGSAGISTNDGKRLERAERALDEATHAALPALLDELDRQRAELSHMADDAGNDSCAAYAVENERLRKEVVNLTAKNNDLHDHAMNADDCLGMVRDRLASLGCEHGEESHESTPPMMYPEWISCVVNKARADALKGGNAGENERLRKALEAVLSEIDRTKDDHAHGCLAAMNPSYRCKCGWPEVFAEIRAALKGGK